MKSIQLIYGQDRVFGTFFDRLQKEGKCFFRNFVYYSELLRQKASPLCRFLLKHDCLDAMEDALIDDMNDFSFLSGLLKHKRGDYEGSMITLVTQPS